MGLLSIVSAISILILVIALIFSARFRGDIIAGEGNVKFLGIFSVKGVSILTILGLFIGSLVWSEINSKPDEMDKKSIEIIYSITNNQLSNFRELESSIENIEDQVTNYLNDEWIPYMAEIFDDTMPEYPDRIDLITETSRDITSKTTKSYTIIRKLREKASLELNNHYNSIELYLQNEDKEKLEELLRSYPKILDDLTEFKKSARNISNSKNFNEYLKSIESFVNK